MNFPRVRPLGNRTPWSAPQTIEAVPEVRTIRPAIASGAIVQARPAAAVSEAHRYAQINGSVVFNITTASQLILPTPQNFRNMLILRNVAGNPINLDFGRDADANAPIQLVAGGILLFDTVVPQDDIYAVGIGGTATLSVGFSNLNFLEPVE
jgi:hypothetical protein